MLTRPTVGAQCGYKKDTPVLKSELLKELPTAFVALQKELAPIKKDAQGNRSKYASLTAVMQGIQDALTTNGFIIFHTMKNGGANSASMETVLMHKSGEYVSSTIEVPLAKPNDPQAYGSAMTYGRRYSIMALLGLVTDDDDGQSATVTLEDRLKAIFDCHNMEELSTAAFEHDNKPGNRTEKMAIRASLKAMKDLLASKVQETA